MEIALLCFKQSLRDCDVFGKDVGFQLLWIENDSCEHEVSSAAL